MSLLDFLFPRRCLGCGKWGRYFCEDCLRLVRLPQRSICPQCLKPSLLGSTHARCLKPLSLDGLAVMVGYEGMVGKAIKKLKYRLVTDLAEELVLVASQFFKENQGRLFSQFDSTWTLVPVPLHPRRERWRGFNQSEILGEEIAQEMGWKFNSRLLRRRRFTRPQTEVKEKKKRRGNIRWAFEVSPNSRFEIRDSPFLLFDDVWTTGSTIKECAQVLKRRKAKKVWGLALAG